jgi:hypothetical protein
MNAQTNPNDPLWFVFLIFLILFGLAYAIPTAIAFIRDHPDKWWIMLVNAAFGGTGIAWVFCLIWSLGWIGRKPN